MAGTHNYKAWIISDGKVGRRNQCIGVAQKLPAEIEIIKTADITSAGGPRNFLIRKFGHAPAAEDWPDIILSSGDNAGNTAIALKKLSNNQVFLAATSGHLSSIDFDVMAITQHAKYATAIHNIDMIGVPHKITPEFIRQGMEEWEERLRHIRSSGKPIISVLIGGDINNEYKFDLEEAKKLGDTINQEAKRLGAAVLITNSPRISVEVWRELRDRALNGLEYSYVHDCRQADGNPFPAMLGMADVIAVTGDSISMCSEATAIGKPVYFLPPPMKPQPPHVNIAKSWYMAPTKFIPSNSQDIVPDMYTKIHEDFYTLGLARKFEGNLDPYKVTAQPLDEAGKIAEIIKERLDRHLQNIKQQRSAAR